eukprot:21912-Pleurochrysis_carterae.AAC.1
MRTHARARTYTCTRTRTRRHRQSARSQLACVSIRGSSGDLQMYFDGWTATASLMAPSQWHRSTARRTCLARRRKRRESGQRMRGKMHA